MKIYHIVTDPPPPDEKKDPEDHLKTDGFAGVEDDSSSDSD